MIKSRNAFLILLLLISLVGGILRFYQYTELPPYGETKDEFMYPFAGLSWIKTGTPTSWSWFGSYKEFRDYVFWGDDFRMVSPWIEKPPLYPLLTGGLSLLFGEEKFSEVRLSTIRLIPVVASIPAIFFLGLLATQAFGKEIGLLAPLLYATTPTIVMGNRLSLTENLLIPLSLATLWYFFREPGSRREHVLKSHLVGLGCLLALLTKNIAFALPATVMLLLLKEHRWKDLFVIAGYSFVGAAIHPLLGLMYDWNLYTGVLEEYRRAHALGLPETLASVFLYPVIGHKEKIFLDGAMLAGYLLLFTSPFWLLKKENTSGNVQAVVAYPLIYFTALALLEGGRTWFGWHLFPLYPFLSLALAAALYRAYKEANALSFMFFFLSLGASSLRFFLVLNPSEIELWQRYLGFILLVGLAGLTVPGKQIKYAVLVGFFAVFLLLQIITVINLGNIYRPLPQPAAYTHISTIH